MVIIAPRACVVDNFSSKCKFVVPRVSEIAHEKWVVLTKPAAVASMSETLAEFPPFRIAAGLVTGASPNLPLQVSPCL